MSDPTETAASPFSQPVAKSAPSVFVTGDLVLDTHIARLIPAGRGQHPSAPETRLFNRHGGAWYLEKMIGLALRSVGIDTPVSAPARPTPQELGDESGCAGIARSTSIWDWFSDSSEKGSWRIHDFLGCEAPDWSKNPTQLPAPSAESPSLLAIDDLGFGFADHPEAWPAFLDDPGTGPQSIVIKSSPPFDRPLWKKLLQPGWVERTTVIVSADSLRDAGAKLSTGLSWDLTIEESLRTFANGGVGWPLRNCKRVVLFFGRSGAAVFSRRPQSPPEIDEPPAELFFERFVFDPTCLETTWSDHLGGMTFGVATAVAALQVVHELLPLAPSSHLTVSRGLAAARFIHQQGAGSKSGAPDFDHAENTCFSQLPAPENEFRSAYSRRLLDEPVLVGRNQLPEPSLLTDSLGVSEQFLTVAAEEIVRFGKGNVLSRVPHLECGDFFTVEREEIERLNAVRKMIVDYRLRSSPDSRPLSLAFFGSPGAGKSFAIQELTRSVFGKGKPVLEFDLAQFPDPASLHLALGRVRDQSVGGQVPVVVWNDFDSNRPGEKFGWLGEFIAPIRNGQFTSSGKTQSIGKCVFIFAAAETNRFADFEYAAKEKGSHGVDFIGSLHGFANIKGTDPESEKGDETFVIRRAIILRALMERTYPEIIQSETGELSIAPHVLTAFLKTPHYIHGARSIESILALCRVHGSRQLGSSALPSSEFARLHTSPEFIHIASRQDGVTIGPAEIEQLAAIMHNNWMKSKIKEGWSQGETKGTNNSAKTDSRLVDFHSLDDEAAKEERRKSARLSLLRLEAMDYQIVRRDLQWGEHQVDLAEESDTLEQFARSEHRRWMREKLLSGSCFAEHTSNELQLQEDLRAFDLLPLARRGHDSAIANAVMEFLNDKGLTLVQGKTT